MRVFMIFFAIFVKLDATGITTHVLDLSIGRPGSGMRIDVFYQTDEGNGIGLNWTPIRTLKTNSDGRTDTAVLGDEEIRKINSDADVFYKLVFFTDEYYSGTDVFYRRPEMVFRIMKNQIEEHFHVPILCTPFSYSTYRGS